MSAGDFLEFWATYPKKVAKLDAQKAWNKMTIEQQFAAAQSLPVHIRYWQAAGTAKEYLPHCATWLNGQRWEDELEMPCARQERADEWWRSKAGIEAKARELGMWPPRTGEDWHSLKARILARAA